MRNLFEHIVNTYQSLWHVKDYGSTIEITTPMVTTNDMFVTVFITKRGNDYIATDGAWLNAGFYECEISPKAVYRKVFNYYFEKFGIIQTYGKNRTFYYKRIDRIELLPNIVFDLANFISSVVNSSQIQYTADRTDETFKKNVRGFLRRIYGEKTFEYDKPISSELSIKFNAISTHDDGVRLINFISGSNSSYYANSLCRSNMNFEMITPQMGKYNIRRMITLLDDSKDSIIQSQQVQTYYNYLLDNRSDEKPVILWNHKNELSRYIPA